MLSVRVGNKEQFIRKSCKKCLECFIMVNIYHTGFRDQTFSELHNNQFSGFVRPELWGYDNKFAWYQKYYMIGFLKGWSLVTLE